MYSRYVVLWALRPCRVIFTAAARQVSFSSVAQRKGGGLGNFCAKKLLPQPTNLQVPVRGLGGRPRHVEDVVAPVRREGVGPDGDHAGVAASQPGNLRIVADANRITVTHHTSAIPSVTVLPF